MLGFPFLRQRPIGGYIVDFFCKPLMLIIETDGYSHHFEEISDKDDKKTKDLEALGYTVLRFEDDEVMNDLPNVSRVIEYWIWTYHSDKINKYLLPPEKEHSPLEGAWGGD